MRDLQEGVSTMAPGARMMYLPDEECPWCRSDVCLLSAEVNSRR